MNLMSLVTEITGSLHQNSLLDIAGADPGFDRGGGPDRDRLKLPMVHSSVM